MSHLPVMLNEVLEMLAPRDGAQYVDGTFGGGGYASAILEAADCRVLGIDRDPDAIARGQALVQRFGGRLTLLQGEFSNMDQFTEASDGIVLDLGVSSFQFDQPARGFSFREDGPLDMRMSLSGESAADFVNTTDERNPQPDYLALRRREERPPHRPRHHRRAPCHRHGATGQDRVRCPRPRCLAPCHPSRHPHLPGAAHPCE